MKQRRRVGGLARAIIVPLLLTLAFGFGPQSAASPAAASTSVPGTVVAWGDNDNGETTVPPNLNDAIAIAAGFGGHSLALRSDGSVVAWGLNLAGEATVPAGLNSVKAIAAGTLSSFALKNDGTVVAWGCLGIFLAGVCDAPAATFLPAGLTGITAIAAGPAHVLVVIDGKVQAYGCSGVWDSGQCAVPAGLSGVTAVGAGQAYSLALKSDGTVVAWGDNSHGELDVPAGLSGVTAIAAGEDHSLALKGDGTVVAWGSSGNSQREVPAGLSGVTAVAAGALHSLALKSDGTVVTWGDNSLGQLDVPAGLSGVTAIAAARYFSLAIASPPPTVSIVVPHHRSTYLLNQPVAASYSCDDAGGPGLASCTATADGVPVVNGTALPTSSVGSKTFTVTAIDKAGRQASQTIAWRVGYNFSGFLQPINDPSHPQVCGNPCPLSVFKGGSTVPVKFQLRDYFGKIVQAGSLPVWLSPVSGGPITAAVDESVSNASATAGSTFRWDSTNQQYIYNWNTKGFATGKQWQIGVQLDDLRALVVTVGLR